MPQSWQKNKTAGEDWLKGFRKRWPDIAVRKPEATSLARCTSFNKTTVQEFFYNVAAAYKKIDNISPDKIYNLDETGLTTVHNPPNVLAQRGMKQVGQVTSGERGILVTVCCFINAIGNAVPPFMIFPRVNFKPHMLNGAPPGTAGAASKSGWVNSEIFLKILQHFAKHTKCSKEDPVILFMDSHEAHISLDAIEFSKENGITLITFPPHTSAKLQPLDRTVYKSLKTNYNIACNNWMLCHPGRTISIYDVATLFGEAYPKAVSPENVMNGFKCTGIWPLNQNVFSEDDYLSSYVTDRPYVQPESLEQESTSAAQGNTFERQNQTTPPSKDPQPSTSAHGLFDKNETEIHTNATSLTNTSQVSVCEEEKDAIMSPHDVRPLLKASVRKASVNKRRKKSEILTDTPVLKRIEQETKERLEKK